MPFFSSFTGSKTAGRRSDGVQNNPQGSSESRGDPVTPSERAVWLHITANQAGVTHSDFNSSDNTSTDYNALSVGESFMISGRRRASHTAQGVQTIVDNSLFNAVRANTFAETIDGPGANELCPSIAVTNSVSNISKTEIVARYGNTVTDFYNPDNIEREGFNDHWIDLRGDAQTAANNAGTNVANGTDGRLFMCKNSQSHSSATPWAMHTIPSEQGFVPAGEHNIETAWGRGLYWNQTHDIGYRPFCIEAWIFTPGPFASGLNTSTVEFIKLGQGTVWNLHIVTYDSTAPTKTDGGWNPGDANGNATTNPDYRRYALPRFIHGGSSQLSAGTANTEVLQSARMDCRQWNHIAWVRTGWGQFGDMVLFANGIEIYRASFEDYWSTTSGYAPLGYMHSSSGHQDLSIGNSMNFSQQNIAYIDDLRLTMGEPVYTKNFTPPSRKLPPLRAEGEARTFNTLADFSYPPTPKPDDLILWGMPVTERNSYSGFNSNHFGAMGNWGNNSPVSSQTRVQQAAGNNTIANSNPIISNSTKTERLQDSGIYYLLGNQNSDNSHEHGIRWRMGSELNDYITNQNGGSGVFDWTIEVGFRSANVNHWSYANNQLEGEKFPYWSGIGYEGGAIRTLSANTLGSYAYDEGMELKHGGTHPSLSGQWERLESYGHKNILRIQSPRTLWSVDSNGDAGQSNDIAEQWIVLSASRENLRKGYTSSTVTDTRHLTLRGYRKLSKHIDDLPWRKAGSGSVYYIYDGYNVDDQGGMSTGDMSLRSNTVPVTEGPLKLNTWHHAAIGYKASTKRLSLFLDGSEVAHEILENDFDWGPNGLQDVSDGQDAGDANPGLAYLKGPSIFIGGGFQTIDVKFTARAKYDSRGYELPANNHAGFGIDGPPYQSINPVDGSIMPSSAIDVENRLGFDGNVFRHWNVQQNFFNNDNTTGNQSIDENGPTAMNFTDTWGAYYMGNPVTEIKGVPTQNLSNAEMKQFLTARYENIVDHANNDFYITPINKRDNFYFESNGPRDPLYGTMDNDFRILKANSTMAITKNDGLNMGGYGAFYFANVNVSNNHNEIHPIVFNNVYPADHTGPLMIDMWVGADFTDDVTTASDGTEFVGAPPWQPDSGNNGHNGEIFRLGTWFNAGIDPPTNENGSMLRVGVEHVPQANNSYWYLRWQGLKFSSYYARDYAGNDANSVGGQATDKWGNDMGLGSTVLPGNQGPDGNIFNHSVQIPFAFTDSNGTETSSSSYPAIGMDVANAYGYTSEPDWWYLPYANSSGGTIDSADYALDQYDPLTPNRSNTENTSLGEQFTMFRQPNKATRKDLSMCDWADVNDGAMHHVKAGMDSAGWVYLYVDGVLLIRVHIASYYAKIYPSETVGNAQYNNRMNEYGNHVTEDGKYVWNRSYGTNILKVSPGGSVVTTNNRPHFMYQDIRVSNNDIDSSQFHIPYVREGLPKPTANIVYGGAEPDANNVVLHLVPGEYIKYSNGMGNYIGSDAIISSNTVGPVGTYNWNPGQLRNFGWNALFMGDQAEQSNTQNWQYRNMVKVKDDTPGPAIAEGKYSEFSLDFDHTNTTGGLNGKNGEYLEFYTNHRGFTYQDHTQSKWMWANNTHSNYNPFRINSRAEVAANPDLYMSSDFTIEMWLWRDTLASNDPNTDTYNGQYDAVIGSSNTTNSTSGFNLLITNGMQRLAYTIGGHVIHRHGHIYVRNGTQSIGVWADPGGSTPTYGSYIDGNHPGGGIPEKEWFHLALCRKDDRLRLFIDGQRHRHNSGADDPDPGFDYTGAIEFSDPWYLGGDESVTTSGLTNKNNPWPGKIEDFRIINGECIYDQDFRPPKRLKRNTFTYKNTIEMVVQT